MAWPIGEVRPNVATRARERVKYPIPECFAVLSIIPLFTFPAQAIQVNAAWQQGPERCKRVHPLRSSSRFGELRLGLE